MRQGNARQRRTSGFSLTEILIVIVIIVILAAVALAASRRMIYSARASTCMSNLRQLLVMVTLTVADKGAYPPVLSQSTNEHGNTVNNGDDLYSIIGRAEYTACPGAKFHGPHPQDGKPITAYGANPMVMGNSQNNNPPLVRPGQITRPSEVILLADGAQFGLPNPRAIGFSAGWWLQRNGKPADAEKKLTTATIPSNGFWDEVSLMPMRHNGRANIIFCDGHAVSIQGIGELKEKNLYWNY